MDVPITAHSQGRRLPEQPHKRLAQSFRKPLQEMSVMLMVTPGASFATPKAGCNPAAGFFDGGTEVKPSIALDMCHLLVALCTT